MAIPSSVLPMTTATSPPPPAPANEGCDCEAVIEAAYRLLWVRDLQMARSIEVSFVSDTLVLRGTVPTYYVKQLA